MFVYWRPNAEDLFADLSETSRFLLWPEHTDSWQDKETTPALDYWMNNDEGQKNNMYSA